MNIHNITSINNIEILQLRGKFETAIVSCSRFIWMTNAVDHGRV